MGDTGSSSHPQDFIRLRSESGTEDVHYSLFYEDLPEEYKSLAEKTLNETVANKEKGLKELKACIENENLAQCTDYELITVLRCSKYNLKKAEAKLKKYLRFRHTIGQLVANMDDAKTEAILGDMIFGFLPYRDRHGRAILFTRPNVRFGVYQMENLTPLAFALIMYIHSFPLTTVTGYVYIGECKTDNVSIYYPILKAYKSYVKYLLDIPLRLARIDVLNEYSIVRWFFKVVLPLLSDKLAKRIIFNGNGYESLKKTYHPDLLPEEFGGNLGPLNDGFYREKFLLFLEKIKAENRNAGHLN